MTFRGMEPKNIYAVQSSTHPDKQYYISEWPNGKFTCTCPAFLYGRQQRGLDIFERECKHTLRVQDEIAAVKVAGPARVVRDREKFAPWGKPVVEVDPKVKSLIAAMLEGF